MGLKSAPSAGSSSARQVAGGSLGATPSLAMQSTDGEVWLTGTLTASAVLTITSLTAGQRLKCFLTQDATGSRTFSITVGASTTQVPVNSAAASFTVVEAWYDGTNLYAKGA